MLHSRFWFYRASAIACIALLLAIGLNACAPGGTAAQATPTTFPSIPHPAPQGPLCDAALVPSDPVSPDILYAYHFVGGDPTGVPQGQPVLSALDAHIGKQRWQVPVLGQPTLVAGVLYTAGGSAVDSVSVEALDANTGKTLWNHAGLAGSGGPLSFPPVLANGVVYIGTPQNTTGQSGIYALRASDGTLLWSYPATYTNFSPFTVDNGMIYVTAWTSGNPTEAVAVLALRASDGKLLWQYSFRAGTPTAPAQVANGVISFAMTLNTDPQNGMVGALRGSDGSLAWSQPVKGRPNIFAFTGQALYIAFGPDPVNTGIEAFNAADGATLWMNPQQILPLPVLADGVIYAHRQPEQTLAFAANSGKQLWQASSGAVSGAISEPVEASGIVYTVGNGINALRASDGKRIWTHPADCQFPSQQPFLVIGNTVYYTYHDVQAVGKETFHVYALRATDGKALW